MKKGINAWCFPNETEAEEMFRIAKGAGFDGIEINVGDSDEGHEININNIEKDCLEFLALSREYGLPVTSVSSALLWKSSLTSGDAAVREHGKLIIKKMIDAAAMLSAEAVLVVPGLVTEAVEYGDAYDRALEAMNELKNYAESKKIIIAVENVWNKFLLSPLEARDFIDKIGSDYIRFYFDAGNILLYGFPHHWVKILGGRIAKVHVKDFDTAAGSARGFRNLLHGDMNWRLLVSALRDIGYDSYLTAELSPYKANPLQLVYDTGKALDYIVGL